MSASATRYALKPRALADLDDIWRYSAEIWSVAQADHYIDELARVFETLVLMPGMAQERTEFSPPVRIHAHGKHLIIYQWVEGGITVLRVLGGRQNWRAMLDVIEP